MLPTAPSKAVSINNGMIMNTWYDYDILPDGKSKSQQSGINESADLLLKMIEEEANKFPDKNLSRILIGGFS